MPITLPKRRIQLLAPALLAAGLALALPALDAAAQPASPPPPQAAAKPTPGRFTLLGYGTAVPTSWQAQPPASSMRAGQYKVPAARGKSEGEVVVFYFGKGQGGTVAANTERWTSQFTTADGKPVKPKLELHTVNGMPATTVELTGSYARGVGTGPQGAAKANQTLLVAVVETPEGNVTFQLYGDRETVDQHRKAFDAMWRGFKKG